MEKEQETPIIILNNKKLIINNFAGKGCATIISHSFSCKTFLPNDIRLSLGFKKSKILPLHNDNL